MDITGTTQASHTLDLSELPELLIVSETTDRIEKPRRFRVERASETLTQHFGTRPDVYSISLSGALVTKDGKPWARYTAGRRSFRYDPNRPSAEVFAEIEAQVPDAIRPLLVGPSGLVYAFMPQKIVTGVRDLDAELTSQIMSLGSTRLIVEPKPVLRSWSAANLLDGDTHGLLVAMAEGKLPMHISMDKLAHDVLTQLGDTRVEQPETQEPQQ